MSKGLFFSGVVGVGEDESPVVSAMTAGSVRVSIYRKWGEHVVHTKVKLDPEQWDLYEPVCEVAEEKRKDQCKALGIRFTPTVPQVRRVWGTCKKPGCGSPVGVELDSMSLAMYAAIRQDLLGDAKAPGGDLIGNAIRQQNAEIEAGTREIFVVKPDTVGTVRTVSEKKAIVDAKEKASS